MPHTTERVLVARTGESPTADRCRVEMWGLYRYMRQLATDVRGDGQLVQAGKIVELARKALVSCYGMARDAEQVDLLARYEELERSLYGGRLANRRAHAEEREH